jgi:zinc transport system substrate-binding protein
MRTAVLAMLLVAPLIAGCATEGSGAPDVMTTFYPLEFLGDRIANGTLRVDSLVAPGVEPHDWEPTPADVARMAGARLYVAQGAGFEPWLAGLRASLGSDAPPLVFATSNLPLRSGGEADHAGEAKDDHDEATGDAPDPHTWLDPVLFARQSSLVEEAMANAFPDKAASLRAEGARLRVALATLDSTFQMGLSDCATRVIIANHDAYAYLGARYNLTIVAISGLSPEAEPSPEDLARAIEAAKEHGIKIIFFEELVSPRVAEIVAREVGADTRVLSPIESAGPGEDYLSLMRTNLANLREAMRCT